MTTRMAVGDERLISAWYGMSRNHPEPRTAVLSRIQNKRRTKSEGFSRLAASVTRPSCPRVQVEARYYITSRRKGERIYHRPGGPHYAQVNMNSSEKRWFCTEEE